MMKCTVITGEVCGLHENKNHPESQQRLEWAKSGVPSSARLCESRQATIGELRRVHLPEYVQLIRGLCADTPKETIRYLDPDTYYTHDSFTVARHAAGAAIMAVERTLDGEHSFSLMRPPGHHAMPGRGMGFCLFNNVSVAAAAALTDVDRVAIIDWDVHHGNGTQYIYYHSDRVLYCSVHQDGIFPGTGHPWESGSGPGRNFTINMPLSSQATIHDYGLVFSEIFQPRLTAFKPEVVIVSAGMDCLYDDILGYMNIKPKDFCLLTGLILDSVDVPVAFVLEGGYSSSIQGAVAAVFDALNGKRGKCNGEKAKESTQKLVSLLKT